ncbi:putative histidyl-tRNA synthetase (HisRS) [Besnoitia besnoiti]|uniref:Histidine--tRNA ligase, cytoplasmic n=1 Tax=Besnoitia besnoiti TaxID=94643 RepID=A0A2A9MK63_BESBE|nr:putative histidyl-tRNA synthetase (HisRS) [Besnoitia besnoiti]PFH36063.1 putative histidyl-tRNA synthetase (HisRS) [Besnoitia besnoiti]
MLSAEIRSVRGLGRRVCLPPHCGFSASQAHFCRFLDVCGSKRSALEARARDCPRDSVPSSSHSRPRLFTVSPGERRRPLISSLALPSGGRAPLPEEPRPSFVNFASRKHQSLSACDAAATLSAVCEQLVGCDDDSAKMSAKAPPPSMGARPLTLDELACYAFGEFACAIDPALLPKLNREFGRRFAPQQASGAGPVFSSLSLPTLPEGAPVLPSPAVRATAVLRIVSLLNNAAGVRPAVLAALCALLNEAPENSAASSSSSSGGFRLPRHPLPSGASAPPPPFTSYPSALQYMLSGALEHLAATDPSSAETISVDEAAAFCGGCSEVAGRLFVASRLLSVLVTLQDCNAALLTEALMLPTDFFGHQQRRLPPLKGIETSATHIANLLHDSKLPQSARKSIAEANDLCAALPLLLPALGNLREALKSLALYLNAELKGSAERPASAPPAAESLSAAADSADAAVSKAISERTADVCSSPAPSSPFALFRPSAAGVKAALDTLLQCLAGVLQTLVAASAGLVPPTLSSAEWPVVEEEAGEEPAHRPPESPECNVFLGLGTEAVRRARVTDFVQRVGDLAAGAGSATAAAADSGLDLVLQIEERLVALQEISALQTALLLQLVEAADVKAFLDAVAKAEKKAKGKKKLTVARYGMSQGTRRYQQYLLELVREALAQGEKKEDACLSALRAVLLAGGPEEAEAAAAVAPAGGRVSLASFSEQEAHLEVLLTPINQVRRIPKPAKGTQDFGPAQMAVRELVLGAIRDVFRRHGGVEIDTPVFELRETLLGKYGENQKLVYDLKDQGGEQLSLRYDLTVPFARYVASHDVEKIRRFHIGKVYRRDEPQMNRGRFREFYQCDFDIAGPSPLKMAPDAEAVAIMTEALRTLQGMVGRFHVKTNHRVLLDGMMEVCGLPADKFATTCSSIDKLDKEPWAAVREELIDSKGVAVQVVDRLGELVQKRGTFSELIADFRAQPAFASNGKVARALEDMEIFAQYIDAMGVREDEVIFDLSLARGLDYYTGIIFEAVLLGTDGARVGSVGGGGRYDNLVGMFSGRDVPAVGMSVGVERLFRMVEKSLGMASALPGAEDEEEQAGDKKKKKKEDKSAVEPSSQVRESFTDVLVCSVGDNMLKACMSVAGNLWKNGVAAEFFYGAGAKLKKQMDLACQRRIPLLVILGQEELERKTAKVRQLWYDDDEKRPDTNEEGGAGGKEEEVPLEQLAEVIKAYFAQHGTTFDRMRRRVFQHNSASTN